MPRWRDPATAVWAQPPIWDRKTRKASISAATALGRAGGGLSATLVRPSAATRAALTGAESQEQIHDHDTARTPSNRSEREPAAAADRRAAAMVRRDRPAADRMLRLPRARLPTALRHLPGVHRA